MANLKEVRTRISSVSSTRQITGAMKMVSAAKLRKAQDAIIAMRPYAIKLKDILQSLSSNLDISEGIYSKQRVMQHALLVPITSNRGLCGAFNSNVIKSTNRLAQVKYAGKKVSVLSIGKKSEDFFRKTELKIIGGNLPKRLHTLYDGLTYEKVSRVTESIMENFAAGDFDVVELIYNRFKNASVQILTSEQYLPVLPPKKEASADGKTKEYRLDYIFEPAKEQIVKELIPKSLKIQLFRALLESYAAEHGARMTAMHKATDNATDMLRDLRLSYNKARQATITNEIVEIVSGAEALKQ